MNIIPNGSLFFVQNKREGDISFHHLILKMVANDDFAVVGKAIFSTRGTTGSLPERPILFRLDEFSVHPASKSLCYALGIKENCDAAGE